MGRILKRITALFLSVLMVVLCPIMSYAETLGQSEQGVVKKP